MGTKELIDPDDLSFRPEEDLETPYLKAKEEWDNRIGSARVQAFNWRICALGLLVLCIISIIGLIYQSGKSKVIPYIVHLGPDGAAKTVGPIYQVRYVPQEREIKYFLGQFVQNSRTLPLDERVARQNWARAYDFLRPAAANKMNTIMTQADPLSRIGKETVQVLLSVIVPVTKKTFQIEWQEVVYGSDGKPKNSYIMTGFFTIELSPPKTDKEILVNPLGLYIKDFSWSKKM